MSSESDNKDPNGVKLKAPPLSIIADTYYQYDRVQRFLTDSLKSSKGVVDLKHNQELIDSIKGGVKDTVELGVRDLVDPNSALHKKYKAKDNALTEDDIALLKTCFDNDGQYRSEKFSDLMENADIGFQQRLNPIKSRASYAQFLLDLKRKYEVPKNLEEAIAKTTQSINIAIADENGIRSAVADRIKQVALENLILADKTKSPAAFFGIEDAEKKQAILKSISEQISFPIEITQLLKPGDDKFASDTLKQIIQNQIPEVFDPQKEDKTKSRAYSIDPSKLKNPETQKQLTNKINHAITIFVREGLSTQIIQNLQPPMSPTKQSAAAAKFTKLCDTAKIPLSILADPEFTKGIAERLSANKKLKNDTSKLTVEALGSIAVDVGITQQKKAKEQQKSLDGNAPPKEVAESLQSSIIEDIPKFAKTPPPNPPKAKRGLPEGVESNTISALAEEATRKILALTNAQHFPTFATENDWSNLTFTLTKAFSDKKLNLNPNMLSNKYLLARIAEEISDNTNVVKINRLGVLQLPEFIKDVEQEDIVRSMQDFRKNDQSTRVPLSQKIPPARTLLEQLKGFISPTFKEKEVLGKNIPNSHHTLPKSKKIDSRRGPGESRV